MLYEPKGDDCMIEPDKLTIQKRLILMLDPKNWESAILTCLRKKTIASLSIILFAYCTYHIKGNTVGNNTIIYICTVTYGS